jgi:hypothetical protein
MTTLSYFVALPFTRAEDGTMVPGEAIECRNAGAAILRAEILSRIQGNVGATPDSHPDCRALLIKIAALLRLGEGPQ